MSTHVSIQVNDTARILWGREVAPHFFLVFGFNLMVMFWLSSIFSQMLLAQLMSADKEAALRASFPAVDDAEISEAFAGAVLYTEAEMPPIYQQALTTGGRFSGVVSGGQAINQSGPTHFVLANYNISGDAGEASKGNGRGGNGNIEFPWKNPGGTDNAPNSRNFKFFNLPEREDGTVWPVAYYRGRMPPFSNGEQSLGYKWLFPRGTIIGEVLAMEGPDGLLHTYEVRIRKRESDDWAVDIFRPFPTREKLIARIRELRPNPTGQAAAFLSAVDRPDASGVRFEFLNMPDRHHPVSAFSESAGWLILPPLPEDLVTELLDTTPFTSAVGEYFVDETPAPTTREDYHIVPKNYLGAFLGTDREKCFNCHQHVQQHVSKFHAGRDWYGHIRGSDEIFSFYPFDPSVAGRGDRRQVRPRPALIALGMVAPYSREEHPEDRYRVLKR